MLSSVAKIRPGSSVSSAVNVSSLERPVDAVAHGGAGRDAIGELNAAVERLVRFRRADMEVIAHCWRDPHDRTLLSLVPPERARAVLRRMLDPDEFLSDHGIRSLSRAHLDHPLELDLGGDVRHLGYEPAESTSGLFGGNSNWRGPVWFPVNYLLIEALQKFHHYLGDEYTVECPTGSGQWLTLWEVAAELSRRLTSVFLPGDDGHRPVHAGDPRYRDDPHWRDLVLFYEYFHGDTGRGVGASHQTGWTALVAKLIQQTHPAQKETDTPAMAHSRGFSVPFS